MTHRIVDVNGWLDAWLDDDRNADDRSVVLEWLAKLADDPTSVEGEPSPTSGRFPAWSLVVPGTQVRVSWTVFDSPPFPRHLECVAVLTID